MNLKCEWNGCDTEYDLSEEEEFYAHIKDHAREFLPELNNASKSDSPCSYGDSCEWICMWTKCGWESAEEATDLLRHLMYHAFHSKLKVLGGRKQQELNLHDCNLGDHVSNMIPEFPEPFLCEWDACGGQYHCPRYFYSHVDAHVVMMDKVEIELDGVRKVTFPCKWTDCQFACKTRCKLREHCRTHTRQKMFACITCGALFANTAKLSDHLTRQRTMEDESFQCSHCLKRFPSERILRDHMRHHVNHLKCPKCDMTCPNPSSLKQHINFRHSDSKPYRCHICPYGCKSQSDMQRHMEIHNAKDQYQCSVENCPYTARALSSLRRHYKVAHQENDPPKYECHICNEQYTRGQGLTRHLKKKHTFRWPSGHPRFRYKLNEDGVYRLQTVRFESVELSQELTELQEKRINDDTEDSANALEHGEGYEEAAEGVPEETGDHETSEVLLPNGDEEKNSNESDIDIVNVDEETAATLAQGGHVIILQQDPHIGTNAVLLQQQVNSLLGLQGNLQVQEQLQSQIQMQLLTQLALAQANSNETVRKTSKERFHPYPRPIGNTSDVTLPVSLIQVQETADQLTQHWTRGT